MSGACSRLSPSTSDWLSHSLTTPTPLEYWGLGSRKEAHSYLGYDNSVLEETICSILTALLTSTRLM